MYYLHRRWTTLFLSIEIWRCLVPYTCLWGEADVYIIHQSWYAHIIASTWFGCRCRLGIIRRRLLVSLISASSYNCTPTSTQYTTINHCKHKRDKGNNRGNDNNDLEGVWALYNGLLVYFQRGVHISTLLTWEIVVEFCRSTSSSYVRVYVEKDAEPIAHVPQDTGSVLIAMVSTS